MCETRDAPDLAKLLIDVILDAGVVPQVVQSDNEFCNLACEEACTCLGSSQLFSTALRPQSQGIVERMHSDLRAQLAILVEAYVRSCPRRWPQFVRHAEHKLRHRRIVPGVTPYMAVHGFAGSSALASAMGAVPATPDNIVWADWLRTLIAESKHIQATMSEDWAEQADARARNHSEVAPAPDFVEGDLVLARKPFYDQGTALILPQCDGPFHCCAYCVSACGPPCGHPGR